MSKQSVQRSIFKHRPIKGGVQVNGLSGDALDRAVALSVYCGAISPAKMQEAMSRKRDELMKKFSKSQTSKSKAVAATLIPLRQHGAHLTRKGMDEMEKRMDQKFSDRVQKACTAEGIKVPDLDVNWITVAHEGWDSVNFKTTAADPRDVVLAKQAGQEIFKEVKALMRTA